MRPDTIRFHTLDGLRGIAALCVALSHYWEMRVVLADVGHFEATALFGASYLFVDFFFVLSGFVLANAYVDRMANWRAVAGFALRRVGRLWPLHAAMLLMLVGLNALHFAFTGRTGPLLATLTQDVSTAIASVLLLQGLGTHTALVWNWPSWSVSCEFWVNVAFAAVLAGALRYSRVVFLAGAVLAAIVLLSSNAENLMEARSLSLVRCLLGFLLGVLAQDVWVAHAARRRELQLRPQTWWRDVELRTIVAIAVFMILAALNRASLHAPFVFAGGVLVFAASQGPAARLLSSKPLRLLGAWSYSIYLVHVPLLMLAATIVSITVERAPAVAAVVKGVMADVWAQDLAYLAFVGVLLAVSRLTYVTIEEPARRWFNAFASRLEAKPSVPTTPADRADRALKACWCGTVSRPCVGRGMPAARTNARPVRSSTAPRAVAE